VIDSKAAAERGFVRLIHTADELKFGLVRGRLESEGIPFSTRGELAFGGNRFASGSDSGELELHVPPTFLARAQIVEETIGNPDAQPIRIETTRRVVSIRCSRSPVYATGLFSSTVWGMPRREAAR
jgi:hypothetical protein